MLISYRVAYGKDRPVPSSKRVAPCRIFHAVTGQLLVGRGRPIPDDLEDSVLRYEDPALQPVPQPAEAESDGDESQAEPEPKTQKRRGTRTRVRPPAENRAASPEDAGS